MEDRCHKLREEYQKCKNVLEKSEKNKEDLKHSLQANLDFFSEVKKTLQEGTQEEKKEAFLLFAGALRMFLQEAQKMSGNENKSMNMEDVMASLNPEQQNMLLEVKEKMSILEKDLREKFLKKDGN